MCVYIVDHSIGFVSLLGGTGSVGSAEGGALSAAFSYPSVPLVFDKKLYIADTGNNKIRILGPSGNFFVTKIVTTRVDYSLDGCHFIVATCSPGQIISDSNLCVDSPAGFFAPTSTFSAVYYACPAGTYSPTAGATSCSPCSTGFSSSPGASVCIGPCAPGTYVVNGVCTVVPIGQAKLASSDTLSLCPSAVYPGGVTCPDVTGTVAHIHLSILP